MFYGQVYQEALLTVNEYSKTPKSDYGKIDLSMNFAERLENAAVSWYTKLRAHVATYRQAEKYLAISAETRGRLRFT